MATTKIPVELSSTPGIVDNSNATAITIDSSERVGIGTNSPAQALHVVSAANQIRIEDSTNNKKYDLIVDGNNFMVDDMTAGANRFTIANGGNVGIGTTSPGYPLEVANTATTSIAYQRTGVSAKKWGFDSDNAATYLINLTDNVRAITAYNDGKIGIGTITPGHALDVVGTGKPAIEATCTAGHFAIEASTPYAVSYTHLRAHET